MKVTRTTLRLPSKAVQYGYAEIDVEHDDDWEGLGRFYLRVVKEFQDGEAEAKSGPKRKATPKIEDVLLPEVDTSPEEAEALIKSELGATNITDLMNEDVEEDVPEWEKPPPKPSDDDWDF